MRPRHILRVSSPAPPSRPVPAAARRALAAHGLRADQGARAHFKNVTRHPHLPCAGSRCLASLQDEPAQQLRDSAPQPQHPWRLASPYVRSQTWPRATGAERTADGRDDDRRRGGQQPPAALLHLRLQLARAPAGVPLPVPTRLQSACWGPSGVPGINRNTWPAWARLCLCYVSFLQRLEPGQDHSDTMSCLTGDGRKPAQGAPQAA